MCDESWAVGLADAQKKHLMFWKFSAPLALMFYAGLCCALYLMWSGFTTLGAMIGPVLGDISRLGFDMAFPLYFLFYCVACGKA